MNKDDPDRLQAYAFSHGYIEGLLRGMQDGAIRATAVQKRSGLKCRAIMRLLSYCARARHL